MSVNEIADRDETHPERDEERDRDERAHDHVPDESPFGLGVGGFDRRDLNRRRQIGRRLRKITGL